MLLNDIITEMPSNVLHKVEMSLDDMFRELGLDVVFSNHFKNRILDDGSERRDTDVTSQEILNAFKELKIKYGKRLLAASRRPKEFIGILKDISTQLNIPFAIDYNKIYKGLHKLTLITLMRKKNFQTSHSGGDVLTVHTNIRRK